MRFEVKRKNDRIKIIITATEEDGVITNKQIAELCKENGFYPHQVTDVELFGGRYEDECFAGRRWDEDLRRRGTFGENPNSEEFQNAFSSLKTMRLHNIEKLESHFMVFNTCEKFYADECLKSMKDESLAFSYIREFYAPNISTFMLNNALSPHGEYGRIIKDENELTLN